MLCHPSWGESVHHVSHLGKLEYELHPGMRLVNIVCGEYIQFIDTLCIVCILFLPQPTAYYVCTLLYLQDYHVK